MRRNLVQSLFEHGKVRTTMPKAKEVRGHGREADHHSADSARSWPAGGRQPILNDRRLTDADQEFTGQTVIQKLFAEIAPKFVGRPGRLHPHHQD